MEIKYVKGDATRPLGDGNKIIVHVCNDVGGWGRGYGLTGVGVETAVYDFD